MSEICSRLWVVVDEWQEQNFGIAGSERWCKNLPIKKQVWYIHIHLIVDYNWSIYFTYIPQLKNLASDLNFITFLLVAKYFVLNIVFLYKGSVVHYDYFSFCYVLTSQ
jgi:hypothetical protein